MGWLPLYLKRRDSKAAVGGSSVFFSFGKKDALPIGCTRKRRSIIATSTLKPFTPENGSGSPDQSERHMLFLSQGDCGQKC